MDQTTRLSNTLTDLLSLSRLESAELNLKMEPTDLRDVANDPIDALLPASENKNIHIESQILDEPIEVFGDREALFQSINSLLDNAIKYNAVNGHVRLRIQKKR